MIITAAVCLVTISTPGSAGAASVSSGGIGVRLIDVPLAAHSDPRAREYIIDHVHPGTTFKRRISVSNSTKSMQQITAYAGGADVVKDAFTVSDPGVGNELSSWVTVTPGQHDLKAHASLTATVTITVPADASAGERYAVVWAQIAAPASAQHSVAEINRVGIRIYLDVGAGGAPPSDFTIGTMAIIPAPPGGKGWPVITAAVDNTGQRTVDISGSLSLTSVDGTLNAGPFNTDDTVTLIAGASGTVRVTLNRPLPTGDWTVHLKLTSGDLTRTATAVLTLAPGKPALIKRVAVHHTLRNVLLIVTAALILVVLGSILVVIRRSRRTA